VTATDNGDKKKLSTISNVTINVLDTEDEVRIFFVVLRSQNIYSLAITMPKILLNLENEN